MFESMDREPIIVPDYETMRENEIEFEKKESLELNSDYEFKKDFTPDLSIKDRLLYMLGALKAGMLIGLVYLVVFFLFIVFLLFIWGAF